MDILSRNLVFYLFPVKRQRRLIDTGLHSNRKQTRLIVNKKSLELKNECRFVRRTLEMIRSHL